VYRYFPFRSVWGVREIIGSKTPSCFFLDNGIYVDGLLQVCIQLNLVFFLRGKLTSSVFDVDMVAEVFIYVALRSQMPLHPK
jgi:hypothetical protein